MIDTFYNPPLIWTGVFRDGQWTGTYSGDFNGCFTGTPDGFEVIEDCDPVPTHDETWGKVKGQYR
jgi:hypothetical protein